MNEEKKRLTPSFTLEELCRTSVKLDNTPTPVALTNLKRLARCYLQPLRDKLDRPVIINSAYRSPPVNKAVGGAASSWHLQGCAADIYCRDIRQVVETASFLNQNFVDNGHGYDELYVSYRRRTKSWWVHLAFNPTGMNRLRFMFMEY